MTDGNLTVISGWFTDANQPPLEITTPEMSLPRSWFRQGAPPDIAKPMHEVVKPGKIITTHKPEPTQWRVLEAQTEIEHQRGKDQAREGNPSYAALKLLCENVRDPSFQALMRVYLQIPYTNTEFMESTTRATQAMEFKPIELDAHQAPSKDKQTSKFTPALLGYEESQQDQSGLVPGGFLIYVVWEFVPGLQLGDLSGNATAFWQLPRTERDRIRAAFKKTLQDIKRVGFWPNSADALNLIWQSDSGMLFWVGFRDCNMALDRCIASTPEQIDVDTSNLSVRALSQFKTEKQYVVGGSTSD
ncbi:hypothetical protein N7474_000118 [Penicillium riverlandense]|uniref:uncharacterized protein n=1 Tax=Penicillium riverlandense TaxID=1903569 RepID=UPI002547F86A|nr:uncharacterized protein N7474_000118 [Penicillium riverlandense]KAJ5831807.1 hypothetical protein N7474_000118 [Penicillium riverlandense]